MSGGDDEILARIIDLVAELRPDQSGRVKLPTERALAEMMDVQRPTVRERLTVLETLGFIRRAQGSGTYLSLPRSGFVQFYFEIALKLGYIAVDDLQQAMEMIGREMASAAAISATAEDLAAIDAVIDEIAAAGSGEALVEGQFAFHLAMARACRNPVILLVIEALAVVLREVLMRRTTLLQMVSGALDRNLDSHRAVIAALREREPDLARRAMEEHYWLWRREAAKVSMLFVPENGTR